MGGYFAEAQGFEKDICKAISEQYLPAGPNSQVPKKPYSVALSLADKIDTLSRFFWNKSKANKFKRSICSKKVSFWDN